MDAEEISTRQISIIFRHASSQHMRFVSSQVPNFKCRKQVEFAGSQFTISCFRISYSGKCCLAILRSKIERCSMEDGDKKEEFETHCNYQEMSNMLRNTILMSRKTKSGKTSTRNIRMVTGVPMEPQNPPNLNPDHC